MARSRLSSATAAICVSMIFSGPLRSQNSVDADQAGVLRGPLRIAQEKAQTPANQPPITKMEGFKVKAGSVLTFGFDHLGRVAGISVEVREMRDEHRASVRGIVVEVSESQSRKETAFVDSDEIPELLKSLDALLQVKANPTQFKNFEVQYTTRGDLQFIVFNTDDGDVLYSVAAGHTERAEALGLSATAMRTLRGFFHAAMRKLSSLDETK